MVQFLMPTDRSCKREKKGYYLSLSVLRCFGRKTRLHASATACWSIVDMLHWIFFISTFQFNSERRYISPRKIWYTTKYPSKYDCVISLRQQNSKLISPPFIIYSRFLKTEFKILNFKKQTDENKIKNRKYPTEENPPPIRFPSKTLNEVWSAIESWRRKCQVVRVPYLEQRLKEEFSSSRWNHHENSEEMLV